VWWGGKGDATAKKGKGSFFPKKGIGLPTTKREGQGSLPKGGESRTANEKISALKKK